MMPKTAYFPRSGGKRSGIDVTWTKTAQRLDIGGWYDSFVGIESDSLTLREFFDLMGITAKDCERAFREPQNPLTSPSNVSTMET